MFLQVKCTFIEFGASAESSAVMVGMRLPRHIVIMAQTLGSICHYQSISSVSVDAH